jgi:hypothetical protein
MMLAGCVDTLNQLSLDKYLDAGSSAGSGLTKDEIISGLKEALIVGAMNSTALTSKTDGFNLNPQIRIPFPQEALKVKHDGRENGCQKPGQGFRTLHEPRRRGSV